MPATEIPVGSRWRLKSGRMVEVESHMRGGRLDCFYVADDDGTPLTPREEVSLTREFFDNYARRVRFGQLD